MKAFRVSAVIAAMVFLPVLLFAGVQSEAGVDSILNAYSGGNYTIALKKAIELEQTAEGAQESAEASTLKSKISAFINAAQKVKDGVMESDYEIILKYLEASVFLDAQIVKGGTVYASNVKKIWAWGFYLKAAALEKKEDYAGADEYYSKCFAHDPEKAECGAWIGNKTHLVKKLYLKARVVSDFNPKQAAQLYKSILKITEFNSEYYKKAQQELALSLK